MKKGVLVGLAALALGVVVVSLGGKKGKPVANYPYKPQYK